MLKSILKYKNIMFVFSVTLMVISAVSVFAFGFRPGIDFTSGSLWQIRVPGGNVDDIRRLLAENTNIGDVNISFEPQGDVYSLVFRQVDESEKQNYLSALRKKFGDGVESADFWTISPSVSQELKKKAFTAIALVLVGISAYIAFAFRKVSKPIRSWKYGVITLITLAHDVLIPAGVFAFLGSIRGIVVDTNFVVALLFVMGFSVHDTIVVFDRIRENLARSGDKSDMEDVVDRSITETIGRSINTSLTLIIMLLALYLWGPASTVLFVLAILIGTVAGTYSSIFFASYLLVLSRGGSKRSAG